MKTTTQLGLQALEAREVPAIISGGTLYIYGTSGHDTVYVDDAVVGGVAKGWPTAPSAGTARGTAGRSGRGSRRAR